MDIEKLIERLNQYSQSLIAYKLGADFADACMDAAAALSTLQAENEQLRADVVRLNDLLASYQTVLVPELLPILKQVKRERDSALKDLERLCRDDVGPCEMTICELCAYNSGVQCSSSDRQICDGYNVFNWKWRGPQKED